MKTYFEIIRDISNLRWSIVDTDPVSFAEVQKCIKLAVTQANSYIWSLSDFPFKIKKTAILINKGQSAVLAPKGEIADIWLEGGNSYISQITSKEADFFSTEQEGTPTCYWIEFGDKGTEIHFFPKPDKNVTLLVRYVSDQKARDNDGTLKVNLSDMDDVLNLPEDKMIEDLYLHCLNTKSMEYLIADTSDENYQPYQKEFLEAYKSLLKYMGKKFETVLTF